MHEIGIGTEGNPPLWNEDTPENEVNQILLALTSNKVKAWPPEDAPTETTGSNVGKGKFFVCLCGLAVVAEPKKEEKPTSPVANGTDAKEQEYEDDTKMLDDGGSRVESMLRIL